MNAEATWVAEIRPWLCQGDIFLRAPLLSFRLTDSGRAVAEATVGPALLATHDCALDKTNKRREIRATYAAFLPLRKVVLLDESRAELVRRNALTPYEALYVGEMPEIGEVYVSLASPSTVPLTYFAPALDDFPGEVEPHLAAQANDTRIGTLRPEQVDLLRTKWNAHWTGRVPEQPPTQ